MDRWILLECDDNREESHTVIYQFHASRYFLSDGTPKGINPLYQQESLGITLVSCSFSICYSKKQKKREYTRLIDGQ